MPDFHAQIILKTTDGIPENYVSNTWSFTSDDVNAAAVWVKGDLKTFYDAIRPSLSVALAQNGHEIKCTALPGTPPNYPFFEDTWNFASAPAAAALPSELAICLSFQGDRQAGEIQARKRGRVYLGPWGTSANVAPGRPLGTLRTTIATAASALRAATLAHASNTAWTVWSPTNGSSVDVDGGWVDDAWDIQRRRGLDASSRTTWT